MTQQITQPAIKTYQGIDLVKFLMAACVVMIHVKSFSPGWSPGPVVDYIISLAVPFFFIASGFLLAYKTDRDNDRGVVRGYSRRIWRMYFTWILIYVPLCVWGYYQSPSEPTIGKFAFVQIRSVFLFGEIRFSYPTWYLFSLAIAATLIWMLGKRKGLTAVLFAVGLGGILLQYFIGVADMPRAAATALHALSRMTIGLGYVIAGMYIYRHPGVAGKAAIAAALAVSLALAYLGLPYSETLGALALFGIALLLPLKLSKGASQWCRRQSLWIYLSHMYVLTPVCLLGLIAAPWMVYVATLCACIALSQVLIMLSDKPCGRFLKKLV